MLYLNAKVTADFECLETLKHLVRCLEEDAVKADLKYLRHPCLCVFVFVGWEMLLNGGPVSLVPPTIRGKSPL